MKIFTYLRVLISTLVVITLQCISALFAGEQWAVSGLLVGQEPASGSVGRWVVCALPQRFVVAFAEEGGWFGFGFVAPSKGINT